MAVAIMDAKRTIHGAFQGALSSLSAVELGAQVVKSLAFQEVDSVYMGCVLQAGLGQGPARHVAKLARIDAPSTTINKVCGSGMKAVALAYQDIVTGRACNVIAGGMESMSCAPYLAKRGGYRFGHVQMLDHIIKDGLEDAYAHVSMGTLADQVAAQYNISRLAQERYVLETFERAQQASWENECIGFETSMQDEPLARVRPEKFSKLRPAFSEKGTITAATSSPLSDGASALFLSKEAKNPLAWIVDYSEYVCDPALFTTAPLGAIQKLCHQLGWPLNTVEAFEINEAFAIVPLMVMQELGIPREKINLKGGACVLGHPLGSSGARIVGTLAHLMKERDLKRGIACLCIGGGEAMAIGLRR